MTSAHAALVLQRGSSVIGQGRLVRAGGSDWFDPPLPVVAVGHGPAGRPAPRPSHMAIPVEGADFTALEMRYERDGAVEGYATVHGTWLGDRIRVLRQTGAQSAPKGPQWIDPPCPAPAGGWPRVVVGARNDGSPSDLVDDELAELARDNQLIAVVIFRPAPDRAVLVVATRDVRAVEAALRPKLGDLLCVVPSRWTRQQLDDVHDELRQHADEWKVFQYGPKTDEHCQTSMTAELVRVTDQIAGWADSKPEGLVTLRPWLRPAASTPSPQ